MIRRLGNFILAFVMLSGSLSAQAGVYRCQAIFRPTLSETLMSLDRGNQGVLFKGDLQKLTEDLSWTRRRQVRRILNNYSLGNAISEREVARFAVELSALLFGKRDIVDNFIFKSKEQRTRDSFTSLMQEKILREGLVSAWDGYSPEKTGALAGLVKSLRWTGDKISLLNENLMRTPLVLPLFLPKKKNTDIGDALIQKVLLDGLDKHIDEIRIVMKAQNRIEAYQTFRRLYTPVLLGSALTILLVISYMTAQQYSDEMIRKQLLELDQMCDVINQVSKMNDEIIEKAYQGAREEFIQKWGEPPTDDEATELRTKIVNGIKNLNKSQGGAQ